MRNTSILSLSLVGLLLFSGCGSSNDNVIADSNNKISSIQVESKIFDTGTHIIKYVEVKSRQGDCIHSQNGYDAGCPIVPEGYILFDVEPYASSLNGTTEGYTYFFINEVDVEVEGKFNSKSNTVEYLNPGKPIENKLLLK